MKKAGEAWLLPVGKFQALKMVADVTIPHAEGIFTETGVGPFYLALEKILADHAGTTNSHGIPHIE
jgi:hypothetical protein